MFLLGHSMGGLIVVRYALAHGEGLAGAIVSGAALIIDEGVSPVTRWIGLIVARLAPELPLIAAEPGALSADPAVERAFAGDPRCYHGRTRAGLAAQLLRAGEDARRRLDRLTLPLLILHGADDTLTSPNGSRLLYDRAASTDKTLVLWPNERHEPHNGPNRRAVIDRMVDWLDARAPPPFHPT
jgi:alpha-beta hydrolase superfamily lysophospholipase